MLEDMSKGEETKPGVAFRMGFASLGTCLVGLGSAATILMAIVRGYEGSWYRLSTIMHHPEAANPAFGYRLLFPYIAAHLQRLVPSLTDHNCFIAVQVLIIASTVYLSGNWVSLFLPNLGRLFGYALLPLMVCPTIDSWNFYDIAIIGFWTSCLLLLQDRKYLIYLVMFGLATLNHENILLIVPCVVVYSWGRIKFWLLTLFAISQVAVWCAVRYLMISLVKGAPLFDNRLWYNLLFWRHYSLQGLAFAWVVLIPWWLVAFMGWKYAPPLLRCSAISLPGLFVVTMLFGKFDEARQFAAFTPTCIGLIGCWLQHQTNRSVEAKRPRMTSNFQG